MAKKNFDKLVKTAKRRAAEMSSSDREAQRRSFAYGNSAIENEAVTRRSIDRAAEKLARKPKKRQ